MLNVSPTILFLLAIVYYLYRSDSRLIIQAYVIIVVCYLNVFPAFHYLLMSGVGMEEFARFQLLIISFFEIPLLLLLRIAPCPLPPPLPLPGPSIAFRLSPILPIIFAVLLLIFWFVVAHYDVFFVRYLGYRNGAQQVPPEIPFLFLWPYRAAIETSFFVVVFLVHTLRVTTSAVKFRGAYKAMLIAYLLTFIPYFLVNSRMQFVLLLLCVILALPAGRGTCSTRSWNVVAIGVVTAFVLIVGITLFREVLVERSGRLDASSGTLAMLRNLVKMIAIRLDSVAILNSLVEAKYSPFEFQWSGLIHLVKFNLAFFTDPETYTAIKMSEVTSPSVEIVNRLLGKEMVDFSKSMILDVLLTFGVYGLPILAVILSRMVAFVQRSISSRPLFESPVVIAMYILPLIFQFEKEFFGFLLALIKWSPILFLLLYFRPKWSEEKMVSSVNVRDCSIL